MDTLPKAKFRTPEDVAPELGMTKTELRRYCRQSGFCTRLLGQDDIDKLVIWIREKSAKEDRWWEEPEKDPFA